MAKKNLPARKKQDNAEVPAYLSNMGDMGTETIDSTDISIPRLKICQKMSTVHDDNERIKDGDLYDSVNKKALTLPMRFIVVLHWKSLVWFSKDNKFMASCTTDPVSKEEVWFGTEVEKVQKDEKLYNESMNSHNYFVLPVEDLNSAIKSNDFPLPMIYSAASAAVKQARNLNGRLRMNGGKGVPIFGQVVELETVEEKFTQGKAFMPRFNFREFVNKDQAKFLAKYHTECKKLQAKASADVEHEGNTDFPPKDEEVETRTTKKKKSGMF